MAKDTDFEHGWNEPQAGNKNAMDPETPWGQFSSCDGKIVCPKCGKFHGDCFVVENRMAESTKENESMTIPESTMQSGQPKTRGARRGGGLDYIKESDLTTEKQLATITAARVDKDPFQKGNANAWVLTLQVSLNGRLVLWSLRDGNPNLNVLKTAFSSDETKWPGKEIEMYLAQDPITLRNWFRADPVKPDPPAKPQGRR